MTRKWSRRPAGVAKELWNRLPHLRARLNLLGPALFTDDELRGIDDLPDLNGPSPVVPLDSGENDGTDGVDTYDDGPIVSDDAPASSSVPTPIVVTKDVRPLWPDLISNDNIDIKGSAINGYLRNLNLSSCPNLSSTQQRWMQHSTYWTYGKATCDCTLPRLQNKSTTGPKSAELDGRRFILAHFEDGSRMIIKEMFVAGRSGRPDRHARHFQKLQTEPGVV